jgi:hypothetical protein
MMVGAAIAQPSAHYRDLFFSTGVVPTGSVREVLCRGEPRRGRHPRQRVRAGDAPTTDPNECAPGAMLQLDVSRGEYYLVEQRAAIGFDHSLPGEGLLVWHVDEQRSDNQRPNFKIMLVQADGRGELERGANRGGPGDPYPGTTGNTALLPRV